MSFKNKLIAIINKEIEVGVVMNAVAHASLAIAATVGGKRFVFTAV